MSALVICKTQMKHISLIISGLTMLGVAKDLIETSTGTSKLELQGYSKTAEVDILIQKLKYHRGYGDVGFAQNEDGTFDCLVDDMDDVGTLARMAGVEKFSDAVSQYYSASVIKQTLRSQGFVPVVKKDGGKIRVLATAM